MNKAVYQFIIISLLGCSEPLREGRSILDTTPIFENSQQERDYIVMMMAYAVVYKEWQYIEDVKTARGYNIGSVIVDGSNYVISWQSWSKSSSSCFKLNALNFPFRGFTLTVEYSESRIFIW